MARIRKSEFSYDAFTIEGSLISPAKLAEIAAHKAESQSDADYLIPRGLTLRDELARYFRIGQALFRDLFANPTPGPQAVTRFTHDLLRDVLGFGTTIAAVSSPRVKGDRIFPLTLEALSGRVPVVVVPPSDGLDHPSQHLSNLHPGDRRRSATSALQDWLNTEGAALWGLACSGDRLRLLRDNDSLTRPAYIEADLQQIFEAEDFAGFTVLWLLLHVSRFGQPGTPATNCILEEWRIAGQKQGETARNRLSDGVTQALLVLGNGFLAHPENAALREQAANGGLTNFFQELLRLVYRLIFLLVAEDRDLLHRPDATPQARELYAQGYSLSALRDRAIRRSGWDHFHDRWEGLQIVLHALAHGEPRLGLPALGGLFESGRTPLLDSARLSNAALMEAIYRLAWLREDSSLVRVNWRDMETEELGSVYEGLLELTPRLTEDGRGFAFAEGAETKGNARKTTGSYYTPDSLVQALLDSALDPVLDRVEREASDVSSALLSLTVLDPACGSGHFLLAAARRIATRLARARSAGVPSAADYRHALRDVVRSSIYGVDRNPMAVELARVALWIETVDPGKPLGFLDANLKNGDSLLGIFSLDALMQGIPDAAYKPLAGDDKTVAGDFLKRNKRIRDLRTGTFDFASASRPLRSLAASFSAVRALTEDTVEEVASRHARYSAAKSDPRLTHLEAAADLYIAAFLMPKTKETSLDLNTSLVPTTQDVWTLSEGGQIYGVRRGKAIELAKLARAFHWPLEFPDVFAGGGFDVVLGNPPWERIKLQEQEFFAQRDPEIAAAPNAAARGKMIQKLKAADFGTRDRYLYEEFEQAKRLAEASSEFARVNSENGGRFPLAGRGDVNTYALFAELFTSLVNPSGYSGVIVPTGIAADATTAPFFGDLVAKRRLVSLHDFQTGLGFFDNIGHARFKFSLLTICAPNLGPIAPAFSFFSRTIEEFNDPRRHFTLTAEEINHINPNTKTAPLFRTKFDAELTAKIYSRVPVLIEEGCGDAGNPWNLRFMRMLDMSNDSGLFRTAKQLREMGADRAGTDWILYPPTQPSERYVPLYEAKMTHQFDHRWATYDGIETRDITLNEKQDASFEVTPRYWVPETSVHSRLVDKGWQRNWLIGFRDITNATNERTVISAVIPKVGVGHKLPIVFTATTPQLIAALIANFVSLSFDFVARQKLGGTSLTYFYLKQFPALPPSFYAQEYLEFIVSRVLELTYTSHSMAGFAHDLGYDGPPFAWDEGHRAQLRAELDSWYARAYGLTRDELRYVLDPEDVMGAGYPSETFRGLKNNEEKRYNGEYRTQTLVLEAWNRMDRGELPAPEPYTAQPRTAAQPIAILDENPLLSAGPLFEGIEAIPAPPPIRIPIDPYHLPANHWATTSSLPAYTVTQLAAIIHRLSEPKPISQVRLAALFALEPHLLTRHLKGKEREVWLKLVGDPARIPSANNVVSIASKINAAWGKAVTQLRGMGEIDEDLNAGTWTEGTPTSQYQIPEWADGRADFVLRTVARMSFDVLTADLSSEDRAWVNMANAA